MVSIENQLHYVLLWHLGQLASEDVLQVDQQLHFLMSMIVSDHSEVNKSLVLLILGSLVSKGEPQSRLLPLFRIFYLSVHTNK